MSFKVCPSCGSRRAASEVFCKGDGEHGACGWDLTSAPLQIDVPTTIEPPIAAEPRCTNGHVLRSGDMFCTVCEAPAAEPAPKGSPSDPRDTAVGEGRADPFSSDESDHADAPSEPASTADLAPKVSDWRLIQRLGAELRGPETWLAGRGTDGAVPEALFVHYPAGTTFDPAALAAVEGLHPEFAAPIETGRHDKRPYEVFSLEGRRVLTQVLGSDVTPTHVRNVAAGLAEILARLAQKGVRHRDLCPNAILVGEDMGSLILTRRGHARVSTNELDTALPPPLTRYAAPELLAGALAAASDWWSAGIVLLELVTKGACFEGVDDQAFLMHVIANGIDLPDDVDDEVRTLLSGLLVSDRVERWQNEAVQAWLSGRPVAVPPSVPRRSRAGETEGTSGLGLGGQTYRSVVAYALAAATGPHWSEAKGHLIQGRLLAWLESFSGGEKTCAAVRNIIRRDDLDDDTKLSIALKQLHSDMPLVRAGEIITPAWLLQNPEEGYALLAGPAASLLTEGGPEAWLIRLKQRATEVRRRLTSLEITVDEPTLRLHLLSTSRRHLVELWDLQRRELPDSEHRGLAALMERPAPRDDDLIILLSAAKGQFVPASEAVEAASQLARRERVSAFSAAAATQHLATPRRDLVAQLDARIEGFSRCGHERVDSWIDQYRLEKRIPLPRLLVALAIPQEAWTRPPRQTYVAQLLAHFEKRIATSVSRGALARMTVGKTSARLDLQELGTPRVKASSLLDHLIERGEALIDIDPAAFEASPELEGRLRRLVRNTDLQRRETGINGLYLGFPFVLLKPRGEAGRARIAPVLLWPVVVQAEVGQRARFRLGFDVGREEVRFNPALQGMLAPDAYGKWEEACARVLSGSANVGATIDEFGVLVEKVRERALAKLPSPETTVPADTIELSCAAVLFHMTFVGQSIVNDIRHLQRIPPEGTGLETLLRSGTEAHAMETALSGPEVDRFVTADSDPTQDRAVARARSGAGLVIEGPPGTGKSQTIVNLVADAIGRKKTLLLICQKQAALDVVYKRLGREGLASRIVMVTDPTRDRRSVLEQFRSQLDEIRSGGVDVTFLRRRRAAVVEKIRSLEAQLDTRHGALRSRDDISGRTYREILSDLVELEHEEALPDVIELRQLLRTLSAEVVHSIAEQCRAISSMWLASKFEGSPLHVMKLFTPDPGITAQCQKDFEAFVIAERQRDAAIDARALSIPISDPAELADWASRHGAHLLELDAQVCRDIAGLVDAFVAGGRASSGERARAAIQQVQDDLAALPNVTPIRELIGLIAAMSDVELAGWIEISKDSILPRNWLKRMFGGGRASTKKLRALLARLSPTVPPSLIAAFLAAAEQQSRLRAIKARLDQVHALLRIPASGSTQSGLSQSLLALEADALASTLANAQSVYARLADAPCRAEALAAVRQGTPADLAKLFDAIARALVLASERRRCLDALAALQAWFSDEWMKDRAARISSNRLGAADLAPITCSLVDFGAFQRFRARAEQLPSLAVDTLAVLRPHENDLVRGNILQTGEIIERVIKREACLSWKQRLESSFPMLTADETEISVLVTNLAKAEDDLKRINKEALANNIDVRRLGDRATWEGLTRFTGPRKLSLREFLRDAADAGLKELRPVWLMNPDAASRLLPLDKCLFDIIVYDEASQMPVEYALPTLYRGRTVVVSGDEKQLPPTSFFTSRTALDEENDHLDDEPQDFNDSAREAAIEAWNKREIQDCPNLLDLSKATLPAEQLQVHYRSQFRELIAFSNASFYAGNLNVPVRHPEPEVDRFKPLKMIHVDGLYEDRKNDAEAERIVQFLEEVWTKRKAKPPTMGVVTFNRDQADLIEEKLEKRAEADERFRRAYIREVEREEGGEEVGFFVKNVENVQGDERDHILFSTTFGRNREGVFRRTFGALGQSGGERRLNVAITRARQRITIFTSMPIDRISEVLKSGAQPSQPRDYLQLYLAFTDAVSRKDHAHAQRLLEQLGKDRKHGSTLGDRGTDAVLRSVASELAGLGVEPVYAADGSAFGIDLAVPHPTQGGFALGIECDAPDHVLLARAHAREVWRASVMKRSIPVIHRISSRAWYQDRAREVERLKQAVSVALGRPGAAAATLMREAENAR